MTERKLASIQRVAEIKPIPEADLICAYRINDWWVVSKVGEFQVNSLVVFLEIDSWVPTELAPFLSKGKEPREYMGVKGERLRTVKLKKQLSQGLILPVTVHAQIEDVDLTNEGADVTELLGILKWEAPAEFMAANAKGNFPSFIPKTDQERVQNIRRDIEKYQADNLLFEVTEKLDGSSITCYVNGETSGVCSRNLDLKDDLDNTWWKLANQHNVIEKIKQNGRNLAVQGEIYGSGINGNLYQLDDQRLAVFDIYDIDNRCYLLPEERWKLVEQLGLPHVPLKGFGTLVGTVSDLLEDADGMSVVNPKCIREGYVYKAMTDSTISFKVIGNSYLLKKG
jgi:RNA ligase (TIGR02306 family)